MFNVELSVTAYRGYAVVVLRGELDLADSPAVEARLIAAVADCGPSIVVDLAGLDFIDGCGLGMLVRVLKLAHAGGGDLCLAAPQQRVRKVMAATGLIRVFSVDPSLEQAVARVQPAGALTAGL